MFVFPFSLFEPNVCPHISTKLTKCIVMFTFKSWVLNQNVMVFKISNKVSIMVLPYIILYNYIYSVGSVTIGYLQLTLDCDCI